MLCPKCGKELPEYERSCPYCGTDAAPGSEKRHRSKTANALFIAAVVLALVLICMALVQQLMQRKKQDRWKELTTSSQETAAEIPATSLARTKLLLFAKADTQPAATVADHHVWLQRKLCLTNWSLYYRTQSSSVISCTV